MSTPTESRSVFDPLRELRASPSFRELERIHKEISASIAPLRALCESPAFRGIVKVSEHLSTSWASLLARPNQPPARVPPPAPRPVSDEALILVMIGAGRDGVLRTREDWWKFAHRLKPKLTPFRFRKQIWPTFRKAAEAAGVPLRGRGRPKKRAAQTGK